MRAIVMTGRDQLELKEQPLPEPGPGQVRVQTAACGICATDLEMLNGDARVRIPTVLGHEWSGWIDAVGPAGDESLIGQQCVAENVLSDGGEVGFEHPGGCGEYLITEESRVHVLRPGLPPEVATLIEPLAVCVRGLRRVGLRRPVPRVLIFGDGPIGLLCVMLLRHMGVPQVDVVGGRAKRLILAEQLGARRAVNFFGLSAPIGEGLRAELPDPYSIIIEASGNPEGLAAAIRMAPKQSRLLLLGAYGHRQASCQASLIQGKELELIGSNASAGAWEEAVRLAVSGKLPLERLVSHRLPATDYDEALQRVRHDPAVVKTVLVW